MIYKFEGSDAVKLDLYWKICCVKSSLTKSALEKVQYKIQNYYSSTWIFIVKLPAEKRWKRTFVEIFWFK